MEKHTLKLILFSIILFAVNNFIVVSDEPINPAEKAALKKFLPLVENILTDDYMKKDKYLIRWLRTKKLDLQSAKEMIMRAMEWRKEKNISNAKHDKKSAIAKEFPIYLNGTDKEGRTFYIQDWSGDIRRTFLAGKRQEFLTRMGTTFELIERRTRENIHSNSSQWIGIYDFDTFSAATHLCVACLSAYVEHSSRYELYYPLGSKFFYVINAPRIFDRVLTLVAPIIGNTIEKIIVIGTDKREWKGKLLKIISSDQLPIKYGGTL